MITAIIILCYACNSLFCSLNDYQHMELNVLQLHMNNTPRKGSFCIAGRIKRAYKSEDYLAPIYKHLHQKEVDLHILNQLHKQAEQDLSFWMHIEPGSTHSWADFIMQVQQSLKKREMKDDLYLAKRLANTLVLLDKNINLAKYHLTSTFANCAVLNNEGGPLHLIAKEDTLLSCLYLRLTEASSLSIDALFSLSAHIVQYLTTKGRKQNYILVAILDLLNTLLLEGFTRDEQLLAILGNLDPKTKKHLTSTLDPFVAGHKGVFCNVKQIMLSHDLTDYIASGKTPKAATISDLLSDDEHCLVQYLQSQCNKSRRSLECAHIVDAASAFRANNARKSFILHADTTFKESVFGEILPSFAQEKILSYFYESFQDVTSLFSEQCMTSCLCQVLFFQFNPKDIKELTPILSLLLSKDTLRLYHGLQFLSKASYLLQKYISDPKQKHIANSIIMEISTCDQIVHYWSDAWESNSKETLELAADVIQSQNSKLNNLWSHISDAAYLKSQEDELIQCKPTPTPDRWFAYFCPEDYHIFEFYKHLRQKPITDTNSIKDLENWCSLYYIYKNIGFAAKSSIFEKLQQTCRTANISALQKPVYLLDLLFVVDQLSFGKICRVRMCGLHDLGVCPVVSKFQQLYRDVTENKKDLHIQLHLQTLKVIQAHKLLPYHCPAALCRKYLCPSFLDDFSLAKRADFDKFAAVYPINYSDASIKSCPSQNPFTNNHASSTALTSIDINSPEHSQPQEEANAPTPTPSDSELSLDEQTLQELYTAIEHESSEPSQSSLSTAPTDTTSPQNLVSTNVMTSAPTETHALQGQENFSDRTYFAPLPEINITTFLDLVDENPKEINPSSNFPPNFSATEAPSLRHPPIMQQTYTNIKREVMIESLRDLNPFNFTAAPFPAQGNFFGPSQHYTSPLPRWQNIQPGVILPPEPQQPPYYETLFAAQPTHYSQVSQMSEYVCTTSYNVPRQYPYPYHAAPSPLLQASKRHHPN